MPYHTLLDFKDVLAKFPPQVQARYDFTNAVYHGAVERITGIICPQHGEFKQYAAQLRNDGAGCPACGDVVRRAKQRLTKEEFVQRAVDRHAGFYSYDNVDLKLTSLKVNVTCPLHGDFPVTPMNHMKGRGCPVCGNAKRGHRSDVGASARATADTKLATHAAKFVEEARAVHGNLYDYTNTIYAGRRSKLTIVCPDHGPFTQTAEHHLYRTHGCPECSHHKSKGEAAIFDFIAIFAAAGTRDRTVLAPKELDIYVPEHKLAIEYCGEYWHAARSIEDEQRSKNRHFEKHQDCAAKGIRLLTIYESEWLERPFAIKRLIRNALSKSRGSLMARKCELRRAGHVEAAEFFEHYHPQGGGGYGEHYGLYCREKLVACMRFTLGANDRGANINRMWTLSRYATRVNVQGGASRLLSAFRQEHGAVEIKSFSDNRFFSGDMYLQLGFELEEETSPDYQVWSLKTGLLPKTAWQRRNIPARIRDLGSDEVFKPRTDPRSEREMTYLLGARRLFDCGKKRWVLRP